MPRKATTPRRAKPSNTEQRYESATVTIADVSAGKYRATGMDALVKRFVGTTAFCASFNARNLASCKFTLYRKVRKGKNDARGLSKREKSWLRQAINGPGIKAGLYASRAGDVEAVEEHPVLDLLRDPNQRDTGFEFWEAHHTFKWVSGNAFDLVCSEGGMPSLELLASNCTRVVPSKDGIVGGYVYGRSRDIEVAFTPDEVVHERFAKSLYNPYYGAGPLEQIQVPHDIRVAMNEWSLKVFDRNARPDYALIFKKSLSDTQTRQAREEIKRRFQGTQNIGEVMILSGGEADVKPLGWNPKELDYDAGRKTIDTEICTAFGIPESFLRPNEGALSQYRSSMEWYARNTLLPAGVKHADWLTERILPLFDDNGDGMWFAVDNPVPQDEALQAQRSVSLVSAGVMTINEARYENGLDAAEEEGADELRINGVPLDRVGIIVPFPTGTNPSGEDGSGPTDRKPDSDDDSPEDDPAGDTDAPAAGGKSGSGCDCAGNGSRDDGACGTVGAGGVGEVSLPLAPKVVLQSEVWAKQSASPLYRANIDPMEDECRKFFRKQMNDTLAEMDEKPSGYQKNGRMALAAKATEAAMSEARRLLSVWGVTDDKWARYLADRLVPLSEQRMTESAIRAIRYVQEFTEVLEAGRPENFALTNPRASSWALSNTSDLLKGCVGINHTTADRLAGTLAEGIEGGESISELKKRVKAAYEEEMPSGESMSDYRSMMIARTETARAQVNGTFAGWEATEVVEGKQWLLSPDSCEFCEAAAKQYADANVPLGVSFYPQGSTLTGTQGGTMRFDFASVDGAPLHPNCKCSVVPIIKGYGPAVRR